MVISLPIPAGYEAIERPMVFQLTHQLIKERLLPNVERIIFKDQVDQVALKNSNSPDCPAGVHYEKDSYIEVTVRKTQRDMVNALQTNYDDFPKILLDKVHGLSMTTVYTPGILDLEFIVVMPSLAALRNYKSTVRHILSTGREIALHDIMYKYTLPPKSWQWLSDMHSLMDTESSLVEWVKSVSINNLQLLTSGTHLEAAIADKQLDVIGNVTDRPNAIEKNNDAGVYRISLGYQLRFNQPDNILFSYPIMIEQSMIPNKYLPTPTGVDPYFFWDSSIDAVTLPSVTRKVALRVPEIDVQTISRFPNGYHPILTVMVTIDDIDELECFNLLELGDVMIDRRLAKAWVDTGTVEDLTKLYKSPFLLTLHKDNQIMAQELLSIDSQFNIKFTESMDKTSIYRVSLCVLDLPYRLPGNVISLVTGDPVYYSLYVFLIRWRNFYTGTLPPYQDKAISEFCGGLPLDEIKDIIAGTDDTLDEDDTLPPSRPPYVYVSRAYLPLNKTVETTWVNIK